MKFSDMVGTPRTCRSDGAWLGNEQQTMNVALLTELERRRRVIFIVLPAYDAMSSVRSGT